MYHVHASIQFCVESSNEIVLTIPVKLIVYCRPSTHIPFCFTFSLSFTSFNMALMFSLKVRKKFSIKTMLIKHGLRAAWGESRAACRL